MKKVNDDDKNPASGETAPATTEIDDGVEAGKRIRLKKITVIRGWEPPTEARLVQEFYQAREEVKVEKSKPVGVAGSNCGGGVSVDLVGGLRPMLRRLRSGFSALCTVDLVSERGS
jgi:hypothetical protein